MDAKAILQAHLDQMTDRVMRHDFATYLTGFELPLHIISPTTNLIISTKEVLRHGFEEFAQMLKIQQVTDCVRLADTAQRLDDALISGTYVTHLLSRGTRTIQPVTSQATLRRGGDAVWRTVSIANGVAGRISSNAWIKEIKLEGDH